MNRVINSRGLSIIIICLAAFANELSYGEESQRLPNVVVILVDDMGYGDPLCYNPASKIPTPHIDSLARDGMKFTDAHAAGPLCHMSRYGLITGSYPFRTDVSKWPTQRLVKAGQTTIASLCQSRGYQTAMVGKWHLGFDEQGYDQPLPGGPIDAGFDTFFGIRASTDIPPYFYIRGDHAVSPPTQEIAANNSPGWSPIQGAFWRQGMIAPDLDLKDVLPRFTNESIQVIEKHAAHTATAEDASPLFLYVAFPAPHTPWLPDNEFIGSSGADMYGDFVVMVDAMIGKILSALKEHGLEENTLVFFSSDNGPTWYDEDRQRFGHDSAGGLRGMKSDAWEAGHRVPFIVRWPGHVAPGSVNQHPICFTDLLATLATLTGEPIDATDHPDSYDFSQSMLSSTPADLAASRPHLPIRSGSGMRTIRIGKWKLIDGLGSGGFSVPRKLEPKPNGPVGQLYDLVADPAEQNNLYDQQPEVVNRLRIELGRIENESDR